MFYSHTFLGRKGPLGTVWCAAHLHHNKLNKSQYISTNIPSTVERIMYPEVPIALRISSHLLLGVVRIYSKQVEYLCQDCNILLIGIKKAFASTDMNLTETATHSTSEFVTLLDKFQLDAFDLEIDFTKRFQDNHVKDPKEITLEDQTVVGHDPSIVVSFDEDVSNSPWSSDFSECRPQPMEEDNCLYTPGGVSIGAQDPGPSNRERVELLTGNYGPRNYPEIEMMRDASLQYFSEDNPFWPDQSEDRLEPDYVLLELMKQKETDTLAVELFPEASPLSPEQHQEPISAVLEQGPEIINSDNAYGHVSPILAIRSTPPAQKPVPKRRRRLYYDDVTVLSSRFMNQQINDSSCILRTTKECPTDALGNWKLNKRIKEDTMFDEPLLTGLCSDLCDAYQKDFISAKPHLTIANEAYPRVAEISNPMIVNADNIENERTRDQDMPAGNNSLPELVHSPDIVLSSPTQLTPSPIRGHDCTPAFDTDTSSSLDIENERTRDHEMPAGNNSLPELVHSPDIVLSSPTQLTPSPIRGHDCTPAFDTDTSLSLDLEETTCGGTSNLEASTGTPESYKLTSMIFLKDQPGVEDTFRTDIPELRNSGDGELSFLAEDDNNLSGLQETPDCFLRKHSGKSETEPLSVRTRAVAQFLKNRSSVTPAIQSQSVDISLKTILEGKRRKLCARMVFETLVLKNSGLLDVQQEESFGDVTLTVTRKLFSTLNSR